MADSLPMAVEQGLCPTDDADALLVERFARGESAAFDLIVRKYRSHVAGLAYRLLGWPDDVDDVAQEVFLAALRGLSSFRGHASLATWLTRITINKCRSHRRRRLLSLGRWLTARRGHNGSAPNAPQAPPADRPTIEHERFERVRRAIDRLPRRYREAVVLRYLEQMSVEEAGEALSARPATVQVWLHRARNLLRDSLADLMKE
jgi:RNA polymerase sigma-70 factor, ECF subfamily